jgi:hypothetical protein
LIIHLDLLRINRGWRFRTYPDHPQLNFHDVAMTNARCSSFEDFVKDIERQKLAMEKAISINADTTSTLSDFLYICEFLSPPKIKVVTIEKTSAGGNHLPENKTSTKRRSRKVEKNTSLSASEYLFSKAQTYRGEGICLACDMQTEEFYIKNKRQIEANTKTDQDQLNEASEIKHKKGYSQHYCHHHSDISNRAGNSKALRDRPYFLSLMAAMSFDTLGYRIDAELICKENWRRFAALATEDKACRKHLRSIVSLAPILHRKVIDRADANSVVDEIFNQILAIYKLLGITPEQAAPFNPSHIDLFEKGKEISNGPLGGTIEGTKLILALTASKFTISKMPSLKDRKIKTPRKSRPLKLRASVPPTAPAP